MRLSSTHGSQPSSDPRRIIRHWPAWTAAAEMDTAQQYNFDCTRPPGIIWHRISKRAGKGHATATATAADALCFTLALIKSSDTIPAARRARMA